MFGTYRKTPYANPGAGNYAFIPNTTLPVLDVQGNGNICGMYRVFPGQQPIIMQAVPTDGYGGLVAGQVILQPLQKEG